MYWSILLDCYNKHEVEYMSAIDTQGSQRNIIWIGETITTWTTGHSCKVLFTSKLTLKSLQVLFGAEMVLSPSLTLILKLFCRFQSLPKLLPSNLWAFNIYDLTNSSNFHLGSNTFICLQGKIPSFIFVFFSWSIW